MSEAQEQARKQAEVMIAFAEGKRIEFKYRPEKEDMWTVHRSPQWNWEAAEYRVAPVEIPAEPAKPREGKISFSRITRAYLSYDEWHEGDENYEVIEWVEKGWSDPRPPEPTFKPLPPGISTPRQALADALRYYVNNPSAWKCYDQELSDLIKAILLP